VLMMGLYVWLVARTRKRWNPDLVSRAIEPPPPVAPPPPMPVALPAASGAGAGSPRDPWIE